MQYLHDLIHMRMSTIISRCKIRKQLDAKIKLRKKLQKYEELAANDPEAAVLLGQYKELTGGI